MKLTEFKGEKALEVLADIIEPASVMLADAGTKELFKSKMSKMDVANKLIKSHSKEIMKILAILSDVTVEEYSNKNFIQILTDVMDMLSDKELIDFFMSQANQN